MTNRTNLGSPLFWRRWSSKIEVTDTCHLWIGAKRGHYGAMVVGGQAWSSHRLAWTVYNGPIPDGLDVCHHCDVGLCVNPNHLFLGTHTDNMRDMSAKGRWRPPPTDSLTRGEGHFRSKLSDEKVRQLRDGIAAGKSYEHFARIWGMHPTTIRSAAIGETWVHVE